ncbi:hypothetical protein FSP39_005759 [Pinctada imbricata]|uniref:Mannosyltransferase n=1 Tax=Pinctada imbricata TaxID=66713 RepID=A0AA88XZ07_PINIB|nr:hypothetical protein FSP39_005759 [Pinctada imbricata]
MSKSTATIRRRKLKHSPEEFEKAKNSRPCSPLCTDDEMEEEEEGYLFDDEILGPSVVQKIMSSEKTLLLGLIALRVSNALLIQTAYVPDEYWQSVEVAHQMVFGYGYLTWEWRTAIRGYIYPSIFALLYKVLAIFSLDHRLLLIKLPRVLQGLLAAWGDLYLYKLSRKLSDRATAQWTLFCQVISWYTLYSCTRTLTNSVETVLVTIAMYYFPWPNIKSNSRSGTSKFVCFMVLSIIIRPTAAIIWVLMCSWHLQQNTTKLWKIIKTYLKYGSIMLLVSILLDRYFYGQWTLVQYNFLEFNVLRGGSAMFGTHPWHWYVSQGYPAIMTTHLLPFILGVWRAKNKVLLLLIIWTIILYSFLAHKEFRFLHPILPLSMHYCGVYFKSLCQKPKLKKKRTKSDVTDNESVHSYSSSESLVSSASTDVSQCTQSTDSQNDSGIGSAGALPVVNEIADEGDMDGSTCSSSQKRDIKDQSALDPVEKQRQKHKYNLTKAKILVVVLIATNLPLAAYFGLIHQRGTNVVMKYLYDESLEKDMDVILLMPCHSTPYYSFIHRNFTLRFLTCDPNLDKVENYIDETNDFFNDPSHWLRQEYHIQGKPLPSHIVYFNTLQSDISDFLVQSGYKHCRTFFHTHLPEGRVGTHVMVSCR